MLLVLLGALVALPGQAGSQEVAVEPGPGADLLPDRLIRWSPLTLLADLPRRLPRIPAPPRLLSDPPPAVSPFWTAGNPAALGLGWQTEEWSGFRGGWGDADDGFRRPLDPGDPGVARVMGMGWLPVLPGVSAIGLVDVAQEEDRPRSRSLTLEPYGSNPYVPTDTTHPDMGVLRVRLEGGSAYQRGPWSFGATVGYEAADARARNPRIPRLGRTSATGVSVGGARTFREGRLWVGVEGRWRTSSERASAVDGPQRRIVAALLQGYVEPEPVGPTPSYVRRFERDGRALSLAAGGRLESGAWTGFVRVADTEEVQTSLLFDPGFDDLWEASGTTAGLAVTRPLGWNELRLTGEVGWTTVDGAAERHDLTGAIFRSDESKLDLRLDLRRPFGSRLWAGGLTVELGREDRLRRDLIVQDFTEIVHWDVGGTMELARRVGRTAVSVSYGVVLRAPEARLLEEPPEGPIYEDLIEPALALQSMDAVGHSLEATLAWYPPSGTRGWVRLMYGRLGPRGAVDRDSSAFRSRSSFSATVGVTLP